MPDASRVRERATTKKHGQRNSTVVHGRYSWVQALLLWVLKLLHGHRPGITFCTEVTWVDLLGLLILQMLTRPYQFFAVSSLGGSKAGLDCLPSGLFLLTRDVVRARAVWRQGHRGEQRGPLTAEPFWWLWLGGREGTGRKGSMRQGQGLTLECGDGAWAQCPFSHAQETWISSQW